MDDRCWTKLTVGLEGRGNLSVTWQNNWPDYLSATNWNNDRHRHLTVREWPAPHSADGKQTAKLHPGITAFSQLKAPAQDYRRPPIRLTVRARRSVSASHMLGVRLVHFVGRLSYVRDWDSAFRMLCEELCSNCSEFYRPILHRPTARAIYRPIMQWCFHARLKVFYSPQN